MYKKFIRPVLFCIDPEKIHNLSIRSGKFFALFGLSIVLRKFFVYKNKKLEQKICGIKFENPVGLAAGFDKNAELVDLMPDIGFGFVEIGSVTAKPCEGNPKPRLHRLVKNRGIIVKYGLVSDGAKKVRDKLKGRKFRIPVGVSVAKTNDRKIKGDGSVEDYFEGFQIMKNSGDYITINISCPNAGDGRSFEDSVLLEKLLEKIKKVRKKEIIFVKISPDIGIKDLDKIISLAGRYDVNGFVVSNLTKNRKEIYKEDNLKYPGGISGKANAKKSNELIKYIYRKTGGKFVIIGCGGIFNGEDAYEKIKSGANLVQLITGMIYEGPAVIGRINRELARLLERDGYSNIGEAVGRER